MTNSQNPLYAIPDIETRNPLNTLPDQNQLSSNLAQQFKKGPQIPRENLLSDNVSQETFLAPYGTGFTGRSLSEASDVGRTIANNLVNLSNALSKVTGYGLSKLTGHSIEPIQLPQLPLELAGTPAQEIGSTIGNLLTAVTEFGPGARAAKAITQYEKLPGVAQGALRVGGMGALGSAQSPQNPLFGGLTGIATESIPLTFGAFKKLGSGDLAEKIYNTISQGKTVDQSTQDLASSIRKSYQNKKQIGQDLYEDTLGNLRDKSIYQSERGQPTLSFYGLGLPKRQLNSQYQSIPKEIIDNFDPDLKKLNSKFEKQPTLDHAHQLQSELGNRIGYFNRREAIGQMAPQERNKRSELVMARQSLKNDITNFLDSHGPQFVNKYDLATQYWRNNVVPYTSNRNLSKIAKGELKNPKKSTLLNLFKNPEEQDLGIVADLNPDAKKDLINMHLGNIKSRLTAKNLSTALNNLRNSGMSAYLSPELNQDINHLDRKLLLGKMSKKLAGSVAGYAGGDVLSHLLGMHGYFLPEMGGIMGASLAASPISTRIGLSKIPMQSLGRFIQRAYRPVTMATLNQTINQ